MEDTGISNRKAEHLKIVLEQDISSEITTGLENYRFVHNALPEIDLQEIDLSTTFLNRKLRLPLLVSSMTGGTEEAGQLNINLARAAEMAGIAMGIGSARAALENPKTLSTFSIRKYAPNIPILANLGAIQLNYGYGLDECKRVVEMLEADALIFHLNPLQEALQPEGNTHWRGLKDQIKLIVQHLGYPVIIKEVGWGISADLVKEFHEMGAYAIDLAGAGGTSWSQVEMYRLPDESLQRVAASFRDWGIPTARAIILAHESTPQACLIASGGLKTGQDVCKSIGLGAALGGMAGNLLKAAARSDEDVYQRIFEIGTEMKICMFAAGIISIPDLLDTKKLMRISS
jgi:isopentenyl-diphosphate Delta-isomerase